MIKKIIFSIVSLSILVSFAAFAQTAPVKKTEPDIFKLMQEVLGLVKGLKTEIVNLRQEVKDLRDRTDTSQKLQPGMVLKDVSTKEECDKKYSRQGALWDSNDKMCYVPPICPSYAAAYSPFIYPTCPDGERVEYEKQ